MIDGQPKAIEPKGITHNATKIGVQDGQSEDLVNLRFKDGSWRATGDGKRVFSIKDELGNHEYEQLYIHTNVYRHLLGVERDLSESRERLDTGTLYWIANLTPKEDAASIEEEDFVFEAIEPVALTNVTGDLSITQTGHLITIIDEVDDFEFFVFKNSEDKYIEGKVDVNGMQHDRGLYPFGFIHFNWYSKNSKEKENNHRFEVYGAKHTGAMSNLSFIECHSLLLQALKKAEESNSFTSPFLICAAVKLYDGSFAYATPPTLIFPRQKTNSGHILFEQYVAAGIPVQKETQQRVSYNWEPGDEFPSCAELTADRVNSIGGNTAEELIELYKNIPDLVPTVCYAQNMHNDQGTRGYMRVFGSDICVSIDNVNILSDNSDIFKSLCIFVTPEACLYYDTEDGYRKCPNFRKTADGTWPGTVNITNFDWYYFPPIKDINDIYDELVNSQFYLLKEYDKQELSELLNNHIVDLSSSKDNGILSSINRNTGTRLDIESTSRVSYIPKHAYSYNGKIHIANYRSFQFHGYPLDYFQLNNHSVKVNVGSVFKDVLYNIEDNSDSYLQWPRVATPYVNNAAQERERYYQMAKEHGAAYGWIVVNIETDEGEQQVVRYIPPFSIDNWTKEDGPKSFEYLDPILSFPDYRANSMMIQMNYLNSQDEIISMEKTFPLKPFASLNMACYISPDLKPIDFSDFTKRTLTLGDMIGLTPPEEKNASEYFPNGLKVSTVDQPMFFPVESTYSVGSSEIVAICSNAIAVGTGQTGEAPLYAFCKDGVYAFFVDASGEITYTNARVIARDVCNNAKSVTPIDKGVVFTTDRGLMLLAGEQVQEIGQPLEGDWCKFTTNGKDFSKHTAAAYTKIADLPDSSVTQTDFLEYLKGAIINYNHNERELMVSNKDYPYTYILDRDGNWSRRDYSADEYVNNYPTSYRVEDGVFYQVDKGSDDDNSIFAMSNVIKLESIGFKELHRVVARGYFDTNAFTDKFKAVLDTGYYRGEPILVTEIREAGTYTFELTNHSRSNPTIARDINIYAIYEDKASHERRFDLANHLYMGDTITSELEIPPHIQGVPLDNVRVYVETYPVAVLEPTTIMEGKFRKAGKCYLRIIVQGSYDGRKWATLGHNTKSGKFRDIGCLVERTDCRFFRFILAGKLSSESRFDYYEVSSKHSRLGTKMR